MPTYKYRANQRVSYTKFARKHIKNAIIRSLDRRDHVIETKARFAFVVGCGHTGTTLMTSRLGRHRDVLAVPRESGIFLPHNSIRHVKQLLETWDDFASMQNKSVVVEKTPRHVHAVDRIRDLVPAAQFILMVRNPLDCISSLHERFADFEMCLQRWVLDHAAVLDTAKRYNAPIVRYEDLTADPQGTLAEVQQTLGLSVADLEANALSSIHDFEWRSTDTVVRVRATQVSLEIRPNTGKWKLHLSADQVDQIVKRTFDLSRELGYKDCAGTPVLSHNGSG